MDIQFRNASCSVIKSNASIRISSRDWQISRIAEGPHAGKVGSPHCQFLSDFQSTLSS